jgi:hypothetical protein
MTADLAALYGVGLIVAGAFILCALMWFCHSARDWLQGLRQAFLDGKARGEADAMRLMHRNDCDDTPTAVDEAVLRAQMDYDRYRFQYLAPGEHDIAWRRP